MSETVADTTVSSAAQYPNLTPWKPGQSGNPNGRPKKNREAEAVALSNSQKAMKKLVTLIDSEDEKVALAAAQAIIDRAMGKPKQSLDIAKSPHTLDEVDTDDLIASIHTGADSDGTTEAEESD